MVMIRPPSARPHPWQKMAGDTQHRADHGVEFPPPLVDRHRGHRLRRRATDVVDQDIEAAEFLLDGGIEGRDAVGLREVGGDRIRLPAVGGDRAHRVRQARLVAP